MCLGLVELHEAMSVYSSSFDAALVAPGDLASVMAHAGAIEKMAANIASSAAVRMAKAGKAGSEQRAVDELSKATGTSRAKAKRAVETAKRLEAQPKVAKAAKAGELSADQAELVSKGAEADPSATEELIELARKASMSELAQQVARKIAGAGDPNARRRRAHEGRSLRSWTDVEGTWHLYAHGLPEDGARVMSAIERLAGEVFDQARKDGRRERPEAYAFDALVRLASGEGTARAGYEVMVRVDFEALLRGYAQGGETCEIAGYGPVPVQAVYDIMDSADPFLRCIVTKAKDIVGVAHLGRRPNAHQKSALDWLFPTCAAEGCGVRAHFLQTDHRVDWAKTHFTVFDLLDRLCRRHHAMKTNEGWSLVAGKGKRAFVAPGDPRHPGNAGATAREANPGTGPPSAA